MQQDTPASFERVEQAAAAVRARLGEDAGAPLGLILGSGLGAVAEQLEQARAVAYTELPHFPVSTVAGHRGRLVRGVLAGVPVLVMQGRFHLYEGWPAGALALPVRVLGRLGVRVLVVTNAAGGIAAHLEPGDLMLLADHLNLTGSNPLEGPNDERFGPRFFDLSCCYPEPLRAALRVAGRALGLELKQGVYAAVRGPSYETPAEIRMLERLGADAVGMSTVPEVIVANHMGMRTLGLSAIANRAAGQIPGHRLTHQEVVETMAQVAGRLAALLRAAAPALLQASGEVAP
ncbi:MAG: purine nucleoside phosphorylase [Planctomycetota bacterium]|nr:MAG: purine nucleoside phosphorylase [Planctomycetota bacterium]